MKIEVEINMWEMPENNEGYISFRFPLKEKAVYMNIVYRLSEKSEAKLLVDAIKKEMLDKGEIK